MLNDRERTSRILSAIQSTVRPGDVVVDIGTGTGVLAIAAARAGARHVYAVEASGIAGAAKAIIEINQLQNRITLIQGWSTQIELPEPADVLVTETIGNDGPGEQILEIILDARKRLLKPSARLIPRQLSLWALLITTPSHEFTRHVCTQEALANWRSWYNIDFQPLGTISLASPVLTTVDPWHSRDWQRLGEAVMLSSIDLASFSSTSIEASSIAVATGSGELNGVLVFFETELSPGNRLSTHPGQVPKDTNWRNCLHILPTPMHVDPGDRFSIRYGYRALNGGFDMRVERIPAASI